MQVSIIINAGPGLHVKSDCMNGGLYSRMSFIYKYKTSTLTPFVKPCNILNLAKQNVFYVPTIVHGICLMQNPGSTIIYNHRT